MEALPNKVEVGAEGKVTLPRLHLHPGTPIEVIVLVREAEAEYEGLLKSSESTTAFWDNSVDDEVWNNA